MRYKLSMVALVLVTFSLLVWWQSKDQTAQSVAHPVRAEHSRESPASFAGEDRPSLQAEAQAPAELRTEWPGKSVQDSGSLTFSEDVSQEVLLESENDALQRKYGSLELKETTALRKGLELELALAAQNALAAEWEAGKYEVEYTPLGEPRQPRTPGELAQQRIVRTDAGGQKLVELHVATLNPAEHAELYALSRKVDWLRRRELVLEGKH